MELYRFCKFNHNDPMEFFNIIFALSDKMSILQYGYCSMEQRQYEEAIVAFKEYLNVDSDIYWYLIEYSNNENYSRKKVKECLEKCMLLQKKY